MSVEVLKIKNFKGFYINDKSKHYFLELDEIIFHKGDRIRITGASGSGKSLLLESLFLLRPFESDEIIIENKSNSLKELRTISGYIPQKPNLPKMSIRDLSEKYRSQQSYDLIKKYLEFFPHLDKNSNYGDLSGGELQVFHIFLNLFSDLKILLFDEAFHAMDKELRDKIENFLFRQQGDKVFIFVHHLEKSDFLKPLKEIKTINAKR